MRERKLFAFLMLLALSSVPLLYVRPAVASPTTTISVDPSSTLGTIPGTTISINLYVSGAYNMYGWDIKLYFNKLLLQYIGAVKGSLLNGTYYGVPIGQYFVETAPTLANIQGYSDIGNTRTGEVPGKTGSGIAAVVYFRVIEIYSGAFDLEGGKWIERVDDGDGIPNEADTLVDRAWDAKNDGSFDNTGLVGTWMNADLAGRSAWPEHHHFVISKDEDFNGVNASNTLFGKVRSLGPNPAYLMVGFTDLPDVLTPTEHFSDPTSSRIAAGTIVDPPLFFNYGPLNITQDGSKINITARAYFSWGGTYWYPGPDQKSFSFAVVWP